VEITHQYHCLHKNGLICFVLSFSPVTLTSERALSSPTVRPASLLHPGRGTLAAGHGLPSGALRRPRNPRNGEIRRPSSRYACYCGGNRIGRSGFGRSSGCGGEAGRPARRALPRRARGRIYRRGGARARARPGGRRGRARARARPGGRRGGALWQSRLNYSGSSALVIAIQPIITQRTSNGTTYWSVGSPPIQPRFNRIEADLPRMKASLQSQYSSSTFNLQICK
jgi:hypothetical protein